jgi:hypothetical protein
MKGKIGKLIKKTKHMVAHEWTPEMADTGKIKPLDPEYGYRKILALQKLLGGGDINQATFDSKKATIVARITA